LSESDLLRIGVACYAGYKGEQTPRAIVLGERRVVVVDVMDQWLAPDHRYFKIRGDDDDVYLVRQDVRSGEWTLTMCRPGSARDARACS